MLSITLMIPFNNTNAVENNIAIVSSTTIFPFLSLFSEQFAKKFSYRTPVIESIGTGPAMKSFCSNKGSNSPDVAAASRKIKESEINLCNKNNMGEIIEIKFGYDGIAVATSNTSQRLSLSREQLFEALFAYSLKNTGKLVPNQVVKWSDISPSLPDSKIVIYGPHKNTGTYDSIIQLAVKNVCMVNKTLIGIVPDITKRSLICSSIREDSAFIEVGASESLVVRRIQNDPRIVGVFGLVFLLKNLDKLQGSEIDGIEPTAETVSSGIYPFSRMLYLYIKKDNIATTVGLKDFVKEVVSSSVIGSKGYLTNAGLASINDTEVQKQYDLILEILKYINTPTQINK